MNEPDDQLDYDADQLNNEQEYYKGTDPCNPDTDSDGMNDGWESTHSCLNPRAGDSLSDPDSDGLANLAEFSKATDPCDPDTDGDGLTDGEEVNTYHTDPTKMDTDGDGLSDYYEINVSHTDPNGNDADHDGLSDGDEIKYGTNPFDPDTDNDGLSDYDEVMVYFTNPNAIDTDGDGLSDWSEVNYYHTSPLLWDSDGDGLSDGYEVAIGTGSGTDDSDGDGMKDKWEDLYDCVDPLTPDAGADPDGDGLTNLAEYQHDTNPCVADTDGDGLSDGYEVNTSHTNPNRLDTDGDALSDSEEINIYGTNPNNPDTDNDSFSDGLEIIKGTDPNDPLSHPDPQAYLVNYQGRLMGSGGVPVSGIVHMTFRIFGELSGGVALWSETQTVSVSDGIYNVLLGSVVSLDPGAFYSSILYLEVEVEGEVMSPRTRIISVPNAIHASRAFGGRLEMDTRSLTITRNELSWTVQVSFNMKFAGPPKVLVSPPENQIGGKSFVPSEVFNITAEGFEVTFRSLTGASSGSSSFTYMAFGE